LLVIVVLWGRGRAGFDIIVFFDLGVSSVVGGELGGFVDFVCGGWSIG